MSTDTAHITARWRQLAQTAAGIVPSEVHGEPNKHDADALASDLHVLARDVNALLEAYGSYSVFALGMAGSDREYFTLNLDDAVSSIYHAAEEYEDSLADRMRDLTRAIERV